MVEFLLEQGTDVELKVDGYIYLDQIPHSKKRIDALLIKYGAELRPQLKRQENESWESFYLRQRELGGRYSFGINDRVRKKSNKLVPDFNR